MAEDGVLVGKGTFRVDRAAALRKLAAFQLEDEELLVPWVRLAVCLGAKRLRVDFRRGRVVIGFDGRPLPAAALKDPLSALLASGARRPELVYLAAGYLGLSRLGGKPALWAGPQGTSVGADIEDPDALLRARRGIAARLAFCPVRLDFDGVPLVAPPSGGLEWRDGAVSSSALPAADPWRKESRIRLCVHGALAQTVERDIPWAAVEAVVRDDSLALDASLSKVVLGADVDALVESLGRRVRALVRREAMDQVKAAPRLNGLLANKDFRRAWAGAPYPDDGALSRLAQRFLGDKPLPREPYEALLRARLRARWLRACVKGRLNSYETEVRDKTRRALWNAPLFPNADGEWLSYRQLVRLRRNFGALVVVPKPVRWADLRVKVGGMRSLPVRAPHLVWRACREDEADLVRLFGDDAVRGG